MIILLISSRELVRSIEILTSIKRIWSNCFDWVSNKELSDKKIRSSLNLIEMTEINFFRFLNVNATRTNFLCSSFTKSSFARINVSSVWRFTISKWLMNSMNSMCSKHESNVDSIIESFFLWCFWYILNRCVSVSSTSYNDLTTRRIEFFDKLISRSERMKNSLLRFFFDWTYAWVMSLK
jgi:hypothetical protein